MIYVVVYGRRLGRLGFGKVLEYRPLGSGSSVQGYSCRCRRDMLLHRVLRGASYIRCA